MSYPSQILEKYKYQIVYLKNPIDLLFPQMNNKIYLKC